LDSCSKLQCREGWTGGIPHQGLNTYRLGLNQKCLMKAGGQGDERRRMLIMENEDKLLQGFKQKKPGIILGLEKV